MLNFIQFQGALQLGLIYSLIAIGVYLSFRVLQFPDMTVDGSFPLGASVAATLLIKGVDPFYATLAALFAGALAGLATALLSTRLKIFGLLAGILSMSALYSINLRVMGNKPNISLMNVNTIFQSIEGPLLHGYSAKLYGLSVIVGLSIVAVGLFLKSQMGLAVRATGNNPRMAKAQGINEDRMICLGLAISNSLVALAGALFCQCFGFADVSLGVGTIIIGLASLILGEALFSTRSIWVALLASLVGAVIYRLLISIALNAGEVGLQPSDLNLISALLIAVFMGMPIFKKIFKLREAAKI